MTPIHTARNGIIALFALVLSAIFALTTLSGCASDNIHQPTLLPPSPDDLLITGKVTSSIPDFPLFEPIINDDSLKVEWTNLSGSRATLVLGEFSLYISVMNMNLTIGEMTIENVLFEYDEQGNAIISQPTFECQAGDYYTKGSLEGTYHKADQSISITIEYKPGSMPFLVKSQFNSIP